MKPIRILSACLSACFFAQSAAADLPGIRSPYTAPLAQLLAAWPKSAPDSSALKLECYDTPENRTYIGVRQRLVIAAPLLKIRAILDDYSHYPNLFDGLIRSEVKERNGNHLLVASEQKIPVPFVPNERDEILYQINDSTPGRVSYLYQLAKSNHLKFNDGFIVLEPQPGASQATLYTELDFWDADWGIFKHIAPDKIWHDSISGLLQSDLAIKLKAENPDWSYERVLKQSSAEADSPLIDSCVRARKPPIWH